MVNMMENYKNLPILIDLDNTMVQMTQKWLERYNAIKGTNFTNKDIKDYDVGLVCQDQQTLYNILDEDKFFYDMDAMPGAEKYFQKLIDEGYDIVVLTQPPRCADYAIRDKRRWLADRFPSFDLSNVVYAHRKDLIRGSVLFDDKPDHLVSWKRQNPNGLTATLNWPYNKVPVDFRGSLKQGWRSFYEFIKQKGVGKKDLLKI